MYYNTADLSVPAQELAAELDMVCLEPELGFEACGIPLGSHDYMQDQLQRKLDRNDRLFEHLREMDPQCANLLLRNAGLPRMGFLLRGVPSDDLLPFARQFDDTVLGLFREIAHLPNDELTNAMIQVHLRHGGFGFAKQAPLAAGANLASLLLTLPILCKFFSGLEELVDEYKQERDSGVVPDEPADTWRAKAQDAGLHFIVWLIDAWEHLCQLQLPANTLPSHPMELLCGFFVKKAVNMADPQKFRIQRFLSHEYADLAHQQLLVDIAPHPALAARIKSNQHSGATAWLRVVPTHQALRLNAQEFHTTAQLHAGIRPAILPNVLCVCKKELTVPHALSCRCLRHRFTRHDALVDDTTTWLRRRRVHAIKECHVSDTGKDRIDIWVRADSTVRWIDFIVTDPGCNSIRDKAAKEAGAAAKRAEGFKISNWKDLAEEKGAIVVPCAIETTGRRGSALEQFLCDMEAASSEGPSRISLLEQLAITLQKFNVQMIREAATKAMGVHMSKRRFVRRPYAHADTD